MKRILFILLIVMAGCKKELPAPEVTFVGVDDGKGFVQFTAESLNALSYVWDFGDGSAISTQKNSGHSYDANGTYVVKLEATGPWGKTTVSKPLTITGVRGVGYVLDAQRQEQCGSIYRGRPGRHYLQFLPKWSHVLWYKWLRDGQ